MTDDQGTFTFKPGPPAGDVLSWEFVSVVELLVDANGIPARDDRDGTGHLWLHPMVLEGDAFVTDEGGIRIIAKAPKESP